MKVKMQNEQQEINTPDIIEIIPIMLHAYFPFGLFLSVPRGCICYFE